MRKLTGSCVRPIWGMLVVVLIGLVSACSTEPVNPPTELQDFKTQVNIDRLWKRSVGAGDDELSLELSAVVVNDRLVTIDVYGLLSFVDMETGKRTFERDLDERVIGGLAQGGLCLFYTTAQGDLVCVDKESGNPRWRRNIASEVVSPAGTSGSVVVVHATDGTLFAHDTSEGNLLWRYDNPTPVLTLRGNPTPVVDNGQVISSFADGEMIALDARNGSVQWKFSVGSATGRTELERLVDSDGTPFVNGNTVYAVAYQGKVVAVDRRTGTEMWAKPMSSFNAMAVDDSRAFLSLADGTIMSLNSQNGNKAWESEVLKYRRTGAINQTVDYVLVDDFEGYVHVLSKRTGELVGRLRPDRNGIMGDTLVLGDRFYYYARDGYLVAYQIFVNEQ